MPTPPRRCLVASSRKAINALGCTRHMDASAALAPPPLLVSTAHPSLLLPPPPSSQTLLSPSPFAPAPFPLLLRFPRPSFLSCPFPLQAFSHGPQSISRRLTRPAHRRTKSQLVPTARRPILVRFCASGSVAALRLPPSPSASPLVAVGAMVACSMGVEGASATVSSTASPQVPGKCSRPWANSSDSDSPENRAGGSSCCSVEPLLLVVSVVMLALLRRSRVPIKSAQSSVSCAAVKSGNGREIR
jgi:hypothetical protein